MPAEACLSQHGANRRRVVPVRPLRSRGFGPAGASGQAPRGRGLAPTRSVPPTECRAGAAFMDQRLRPEGRERHGARPTGACFCQRRANRRQVALVPPSRLKGFGPAALNGPAPGRGELALRRQVPPTASRTETAFMTKGLRPGGRERPGAMQVGACFRPLGATGRVPYPVRRCALRSRASPSLRSILVTGCFERPSARADGSLLPPARAPRSCALPEGGGCCPPAWPSPEPAPCGWSPERLGAVPDGSLLPPRQCH